MLSSVGIPANSEEFAETMRSARSRNAHKGNCWQRVSCRLTPSWPGSSEASLPSPRPRAGRLRALPAKVKSRDPKASHLSPSEPRDPIPVIPFIAAFRVPLRSHSIPVNVAIPPKDRIAPLTIIANKVPGMLVGPRRTDRHSPYVVRRRPTLTTAPPHPSTVQENIHHNLIQIADLHTVAQRTATVVRVKYHRRSGEAHFFRDPHS